MSEKYSILPFQFSYRKDGSVLLVNEAGDFLFADGQEFDLFVRHELPMENELFFLLKSHNFLYHGDDNIYLRKIAARYRSRKTFLREFTMLHMMVITLRCNQKCEYCQVSCAEEDAYKYDMSKEVALKIVDMIFSAPTKYPKIEFQGGEPLLNWEVIETVVLYAEEKAKSLGKKVDFVICTNLTLITDDNILFCKEHNIMLSTSLDGPQGVHDSCRKTRLGEGTHALFKEKLQHCRQLLGHDAVDALMTTSAFSLDHMKEIVDEYIKLGMSGIFIRALNPYGFAAEKSEMLGYSMDKFVEKYFDALNYIFEINKYRFFPEYFATLLFSRILSPFSTGFVDLQSPAGAGISGAIYDYDGSVFPADEARMLARMGDRHFCLGNVCTDRYEDIFAGTLMKKITASSCIEITPSCAWCAYQSYCGTDPVRNYLETGNELRRMHGSPFCEKNKAIFDGLFDILKHADSKTMDIIWSWINKNPHLVNYERV